MWHTNISCLDHADIITTISDTTNSLPSMLSNEPCHICLLRGRTSTSNNSRQLRGNLNKLILEEVKT